MGVEGGEAPAALEAQRATIGSRQITIGIVVAMGCAADLGFGKTSENTQGRGAEVIGIPLA